MIELYDFGPQGALGLRFAAPQLPQDAADYVALFARLAAQPQPFVLYSDLRGFTLDHEGEVAQNLAAKATRAEISSKIRGLILVTDGPSERKRLVFANFWDIPVEVHNDGQNAIAGFWAMYERVMND